MANFMNQGMVKVESLGRMPEILPPATSTMQSILGFLLGEAVMIEV